MECGLPAEEVVCGKCLAFLCSIRLLVILEALIKEGDVVEVGEGFKTTLPGEGTSAFCPTRKTPHQFAMMPMTENAKILVANLSSMEKQMIVPAVLCHLLYHPPSL